MKNLFNKKKKKRKNFLKLIYLFLSIFFTSYTTLSVLTFSPYDPSWLQTNWNKPIRNFGGRIGAWFADILLYIFGLFIYFILILISFIIFKKIIKKSKEKKRNFSDLYFRIIGSTILIFSSCSLIDINIVNSFAFPSGGILGVLLGHFLLKNFNNVNTNFLLVLIWIIGFLLFKKFFLEFFLKEKKYFKFKYILKTSKKRKKTDFYILKRFLFLKDKKLKEENFFNLNKFLEQSSLISNKKDPPIGKF